MLFTVIKSNSYQDSINLMLLTKKLSVMPNVQKISVMMGTPANLAIFRSSGLYTNELGAAGANDICVVVDAQDASIVEQVMQEIETFLKDQSVQSKGDTIPVSRTWESALAKLPDANCALLSIAGEFAAKEAKRALDRNLNVFIFSDNISVADEKELKTIAQEKGLVVMGPDCGTGMISGVPLAFANVIQNGNIGIVAASGTGLQEVATLIDHAGFGISHGIGIGGRDLSEDIGGITALAAIDILKNDAQTQVVVFVSKPPAPSVKQKIIEALSQVGKPVVSIFLGDNPEAPKGNMHYAWTLEDCAAMAVQQAREFARMDENMLATIAASPTQRKLIGLYSGGTLAGEAAMILEKELELPHRANHDGGIMLEVNGHKIIDLGDDAFTKGKPHPMMDPATRLAWLDATLEDPDVAIVLLDFVLGFGGHENIAAVFAPAIAEHKAKLKAKNKDVYFIASVTGTTGDPQGYEAQVELLTNSGILVCQSNAEAVTQSVRILETLNHPANNQPAAALQAKNAFWASPKIINVGLRHFAKPIQEAGADVVQYIWHPIAGGNEKLAKLLEKLK